MCVKVNEHTSMGTLVVLGTDCSSVNGVCSVSCPAHADERHRLLGDVISVIVEIHLQS